MLTMTACEDGPVTIRHLTDSLNVPWLIMKTPRHTYRVTLAELQAASRDWLGTRGEWTLEALQSLIAIDSAQHIRPATMQQAIVILAAIAAYSRGWRTAIEAREAVSA